MKELLLLINILLFVTSCVVKRVSRPPINGVIYDNKTLQTIDRVKIISWDNKAENYVIEKLSNENGEFQLSIKTYYDKMNIGGEAPIEVYSLKLIKNGYEEKNIENRSRYGFTKDTIKYDTIFLKPIEKDILFK